MRTSRIRRHPLLEFAAALGAAFVLTLAAFGPAMDAAFVSDDVNAIVENQWVMGPLDAAGIFGNFSWWGEGRADAPGYRPAATWTLAATRALLGGAPRDHRLVNFAMNALCAALLFALARALGLALATSAAAGAVFAVLPIHSEAAIWIVGRTELGAAASFLVVCLACLSWRGSGSLLAVGVAATAIAVGIAFKENAITALAVPAAFWLGLGRDRKLLQRDAVATLALAAGAAACLVLRTQAHGFSPALDAVSTLDNPLAGLDPLTRLAGAFAVFGRYVRLTVWPHPLSVDYSWDALGIGPGFVANADSAIAAAFVATTAFAAWRGPGRPGVAAVGLVLAAAAYSIVSNTVFVLGTILGERLFYLPSAGLCLAVAACADLRVAGRGRRGSALAAFVAVAVVIASVGVSRTRAVEWRTPVSLFEAAVRAVPRSARAHMELASAYGNAGRIDDALRHFDLAIAIKPDYASALYNRGNALARAGRLEEAAQSYRAAIEQSPRFVRAWRNLALTEQLRGRPRQQIEAMRGAVEVAPASTMLRSELAEALLRAGLHEEALREYDRLIGEGAAGPVVWFNRGVARHHGGGCAAAVDDYVRAAGEDGAPPEAYAAAAGCLRQLGRLEEAVEIERSGQVANRGTRR